MSATVENFTSTDALSPPRKNDMTMMNSLDSGSMHAKCDMKKNCLAAAFLVAAVIAVYAHGLRGPLIYDDKVFIVENPAVKSVANALASFGDPAAVDSGHFQSQVYRPLIPVIYSLVYALAGLHSWAYHLLNVGIHAINAVLLFALIFFFTKKRIASLIAAAWWAVHPVNVESVEWISGTDDVLVATFILASLLSLCREKKLASYLLFFLALLVKETAIVAPAFFFVVEYWRRAGDKTGKPFFAKTHFIEALKAVIPYFIMTAVFFGIRARVCGVAQVDRPWGETPVETALIMLRVFSRYVQMIFFPVRLRVNYWRGFEHGSWLCGGLGFALIMLLAVYAVLAWRKNSAVTLGVACFFIFLVPVSNIVSAASIMAEHFIYLPLAGAAIAISVFTGGDNKRARLFQGAWIAVIWLFIMLSIARIGVWNDEERFWKDIIEKEPTILSYRVNLAIYYTQAKKFDDAEREYQFVLTRRPGDAHAAANYAQMLLDAGRPAESRNLFKQLCDAFPEKEQYCKGLMRAEKAMEKSE